MTHFTHCALRLGDNLAGLQLVRKLAKANPDRDFVHAANLQYCSLEKLHPVVSDCPNVKLIHIEEAPADSVDLWKGANNYFYAHPKWREYVPFMLEFYALCSVRIGLPCPITTREDMLFDYPALQNPAPEVDWLVVNSPPFSGQFTKYNPIELEEVIHRLCKRWKVATTYPTKINHGQLDLSRATIHEIGAISTRCKFILMVSTGPSWPTFNVWSDKTVQMRVVMLDNETVELGRNTIHARSVREAHKILGEYVML